MKKIYFVIITFILIFIVLEVCARFVFYNESLSKKIRSDHSLYRLNHWVKLKSESDLHLINHIHDFNYEFGWKPKINLNSLEYMPDKLLSTNSDGYRNEFNFSKSHKEVTFMLGDSFTFGDEVGDDETFSYLLNNHYTDEKFYNLGVSGYGYDQVLLTLKEYIKVYNPKRVILSFTFTDLDRALLSFHDYLKPYFSLNNDNLVLHQEHLRPPKELLENYQYRVFLMDLIKILRWRNNWGSESYWENLITLNEKIIKEISSVAKSNNAKLILLYLPIAYEANDLSEDKLNYEKIMFQYCKSLNLECYSSRSEFKNHIIKTGLKFKEEMHWLEDGHQAVFKSLVKIFESNKQK